MATAHPRVLDHDAVLDALDGAPLGEPLPPELEAEIAQAEDDLRAGRVALVPHAEVRRALEEMRRQHAG